jgi:hypothetical protein
MPLIQWHASFNSFLTFPVASNPTIPEQVSLIAAAVCCYNLCGEDGGCTCCPHPTPISLPRSLCLPQLIQALLPAPPRSSKSLTLIAPSMSRQVRRQRQRTRETTHPRWRWTLRLHRLHRTMARGRVRMNGRTGTQAGCELTTASCQRMLETNAYVSLSKMYL